MQENSKQNEVTIPGVKGDAFEICNSKFRLIGSEKPPKNLRHEQVRFLSKNLVLMGRREAKKLYFGLREVFEDNPFEKTIHLSEAFSLSSFNPDVKMHKDFLIHDFLAIKDLNFKQNRLISLMMMDALHGTYITVTLKLSKTLFEIIQRDHFLTREFIEITS